MQGGRITIYASKYYAKGPHHYICSSLRSRRLVRAGEERT